MAETTKTYPRKDENGNLIWACCTSTIGAPCGHKEDPRYTVATYSWACTAYVRSTIRRALELQSTHNVWIGTDYVNAATALVPNTYVTTKLPDEQTWELTKLELQTIYRAIVWRRARRSSGETDRNTSLEIETEWSHIEDEIYRVLQGIWHSEGKYWV